MKKFYQNKIPVTGCRHLRNTPMDFWVLHILGRDKGHSIPTSAGNQGPWVTPNPDIDEISYIKAAVL